MDTNTKRARFIGTYKGRKVYEFPVEVTKNTGFHGTLDQWLNPGKEHWVVTSYTAADAADYVRSKFLHRPETEIVAYGPKGGRAAQRFIGFYTVISEGVYGYYKRQPSQPSLLGGAQ